MAAKPSAASVETIAETSFTDANGLIESINKILTITTVKTAIAFEPFVHVMTRQDSIPATAEYPGERPVTIRIVMRTRGIIKCQPSLKIFIGLSADFFTFDIVQFGFEVNHYKKR